MSAIISIASGKGGVGKTLVTSTLAISLQRHGYSVLAVDADMGLRNLDLMFGVQDEILYDAVDIIKQRCLPNNAILAVSPGLDFLAASQKHTWEKIDASSYQYVLEDLAEHYDYVLLDCPPGRGQAYKKAVAIADYIFFVVEPTWTSMRDTSRVMQFCDKHKKFNYAILLNNFYQPSDAFVSVRTMLDMLDPEHLAGILPHSDVIQRAAQQGTLVAVPESNPFFKSLERTLVYIKKGTELPISDLEALLPNAPDIALPQEETAISEDEIAVEEGSALTKQNIEKKSAGLSLRQRRQESWSWRRYRR
ncbi:MAG: AAA family ATPase [Megasphaera sp.]|jgi:septum site-determining protein MinD|uniref:AAA family ATPase n=1 Tax=Megasphaera sueciensis TaxID=349094 RepID=UPI003CFEF384|nr:AAA family ATPase [Megasphaera sp.]MCI1823807.1 AAA family ATPase [Megasphaera sp.]